MALTKDEKEMLANYRAQKKLVQKSEIDFYKPQLVGYAVEDLYSIDTSMLKEIKDGMFGWYPCKSDIDAMIERIFTMQVPAGSEFVGYIKNGVESWYDTIYGIEDMNSDWAKTYLKGIKPYKKPKKTKR